jgi:hypothetical protein
LDGIPSSVGRRGEGHLSSWYGGGIGVACISDQWEYLITDHATILITGLVLFIKVQKECVVDQSTVYIFS